MNLEAFGAKAGGMGGASFAYQRTEAALGFAMLACNSISTSIMQQ